MKSKKQANKIRHNRSNILKIKKLIKEIFKKINTFGICLPDGQLM